MGQGHTTVGSDRGLLLPVDLGDDGYIKRVITSSLFSDIYNNAQYTGGDISCAVFDSKTAKCWGNTWYIYGYNLGVYPHEMGTNLQYLPFEGINYMITNLYHTCAHFENREVICMGNNIVSISTIHFVIKHDAGWTAWSEYR